MAGIVEFLSSDTTKVAVTVVSTAVGIFLTIAKIKSMLPRPRLYLKEDIEILKSLDKNQEEYQILSQYINNKIRSIYLNQKPRKSLLESSRSISVVLGVAILFSGIYLTYTVHESQDWSAWWYIGTIYLAFLGVGVMSFPSVLTDRKSTAENQGGITDEQK